MPWSGKCHSDSCALNTKTKTAGKTRRMLERIDFCRRGCLAVGTDSMGLILRQFNAAEQLQSSESLASATGSVSSSVSRASLWVTCVCLFLLFSRWWLLSVWGQKQHSFLWSSSRRCWYGFFFFLPLKDLCSQYEGLTGLQMAVWWWKN